MLVESNRVHAPADRVFAYISEPANQVGAWSSLTAVKDLEHLPGGGYITALYIGMTNHLRCRTCKHRTGRGGGFIHGVCRYSER